MFSIRSNWLILRKGEKGKHFHPSPSSSRGVEPIHSFPSSSGKRLSRLAHSPLKGERGERKDLGKGCAILETSSKNLVQTAIPSLKKWLWILLEEQVALFRPLYGIQRPRFWPSQAAWHKNTWHVLGGSLHPFLWISICSTDNFLFMDKSYLHLPSLFSPGNRFSTLPFITQQNPHTQCLSVCLRDFYFTCVPVYPLF